MEHERLLRVDDDDNIGAVKPKRSIADSSGSELNLWNGGKESTPEGIELRKGIT